MKHLQLKKGGFLIHKGQIIPLNIGSHVAKGGRISEVDLQTLNRESIGCGIKQKVKSIKPLKYKF